MADYYPLIGKAVSGLEKSTGEARRALYDRARKALLEQLRSAEPSLTDADTVGAYSEALTRLFALGDEERERERADRKVEPFTRNRSR